MPVCAGRAVSRHPNPAVLKCLIARYLVRSCHRWEHAPSDSEDEPEIRRHRSMVADSSAGRFPTAKLTLIGGEPQRMRLV